MKLIPLTQGYFAKVDDEDFEWLNQWKWYACVCKKTVYVSRRGKDEGGKRINIFMHRAIMRITDPKIEVDHRFGDGLDNQRKNLRPCTHQQNMANREGDRNSSSIFKGVCWDKVRNRWLCSIRIDGKKRHLGLFDNEEDAARVYNQLAKKHYGEFARLNNITPMFPYPEWSPKVLLSRNTSGFRGIYFEKKRGKWQSTIRDRGRKKYIGEFISPIEAAEAYDKAAREMHGDAARLNFPKQNTF